VQKIAPFLLYDSDPYLVISDDGRLFWMLDAYTKTNGFPYSQPAPNNKGYNYIRNSVKVTIDAYDGTVSFYQFDATDPLVRTYAAIFPQLFRPLSEMPADLQAHIRYPMDIFTTQIAVYNTYHMTDPTVFYNKEDQYEFAAQQIQTEQTQAIEPYYVIMRLPGSERDEFLSIMPLTPIKKKNMMKQYGLRTQRRLRI
jgi:uncharacterized membrane protein (UPF0182 family)